MKTENMSQTTAYTQRWRFSTLSQLLIVTAFFLAPNCDAFSGMDRRVRPLQRISHSHTTTTTCQSSSTPPRSLKNNFRFELHATAVSTTDQSEKNTPATMTSMERFQQCLPNFIGVQKSASSSSKEMDKLILATLLPSIVNLMVVPLVNSVDTFWVGRMGNALALAGQAAANQAFFSLFFLISFLPTITAPLVAEAIGANDEEAATDRVCEALFLSNLLGAIGTIILVGFPALASKLVLSSGAPAAAYAEPYLRYRGLSMVPALVSAVGFAAYRGMLNTVTPLKVSLAANLFNVVADPLLIFGLPLLGIRGLGMVGAAVATAGAETLSGLVYMRLLFRRKLVRWSRVLKPPKWSSLLPLLQVGSAMLARQAILNVSFVTAARCAQSMDPTGVSAAAYSIVMQIYSLGIVVQLAVQATAATLVPSAKASSGLDEARNVADRIFGWGAIIGALQGIAQIVAVPLIVPMFSTLPEVQEAAKFPALITSIIHVMNGFVFPGEGCMLGLGSIRDLALVTAGGVGVMIACLVSPLGKRVEGIVLSIAAFHLVQAVAMVWHYLRVGPLRREKTNKVAT